jgi:hypothetical protein
MKFSFGQGLFNLPKNSGNRPPFPFEKPQAVPKADDFALFRGVHDGHSGAKPNVNEKRTIFKPLGLGPWRWVPTRHPNLTSSGSVGALLCFRKRGADGTPGPVAVGYFRWRRALLGHGAKAYEE